MLWNAASDSQLQNAVFEQRFTCNYACFFELLNGRSVKFGRSMKWLLTVWNKLIAVNTL